MTDFRKVYNVLVNADINDGRWEITLRNESTGSVTLTWDQFKQMYDAINSGVNQQKPFALLQINPFGKGFS